MDFETLNVHDQGAVLIAEIAAPPMNLLGPELVRDLVSLIQRAEADEAVQVLVFKSADPEYFISHVDVTRISAYRAEAAKRTKQLINCQRIYPPGTRDRRQILDAAAPVVQMPPPQFR